MTVEVNLLIGAGGRRNYLVKWFRAAMEDLGIKGAVCVADATASAPALADADRAAVVPPFASDEYFPALAELCDEWSIDMAFSLNDFEATLWASSEMTPFQSRGINLIAPSATCQALVEDKAAYADAFSASGVRTPLTLTGTEALAERELPWSRNVIIKHRFGSGSSGLALTTQDAWRQVVRTVASEAKDRHGQPVADVSQGLDNVVVQQAVEGVEFGLDVVHDFDGRFVGNLTRRKLRMRSGETDQAQTVAPESLRETARRVGEVTRHRGLIDTDVLVTPEGEVHLIDVNPRFGGGYPFSHVAGARIPHAYLAWHAGLPVDPDWFGYRADVTSAKTEDIRVAKPAASFPRGRRP